MAASYSLGRFDVSRFLDFERIALLDAVEEVFTNHSLNLLPVMGADSITGLQINFGSPEPASKARK